MFSLGDIDLNTFIDISDLIMLIEYILEPEDTYLTDEQIELCDLDMNQFVDISDIIVLIEIILEN